MSYNPEAVITIKWNAKDTFTDIKLSELGNKMQANPHLNDAMPIMTTSVEGRHFLAPCLMVTRPEVAVVTGCPVDDGITFATRKQMRKMVDTVNMALMRASLPLLSREDTRWMLSPATPITVATQPELGLCGQPTIEEQYADLPF